jgi:RNA polymerase sigma-70 factor, ECF subfamily
MTPVEAFAAAASVDVTAELAAHLDAALAACSSAHPDITFDRCVFAQYLGECGVRMPPDDELLLDLHLAFAAAAGSAAAITRFEHATLPSARAALLTLRIDGAALDEALQRVRDKLLVGPPPRILDYRGEGRLRAWVRVIAIREHLMERRRRKVEISLDDALLAAVPDPADDPRLVVMRHQYRDDLAAALARAIAQLEVRERSLLRYSLVDGLDLGAIGSIFHTHKSTISRWLTRARTRLWRLTREALIAPGGIPREEIESLVRAMRSGLDLSLGRLLGDPEHVR